LCLCCRRYGLGSPARRFSWGEADKGDDMMRLREAGVIFPRKRGSVFGPVKGPSAKVTHWDADRRNNLGLRTWYLC